MKKILMGKIEFFEKLGHLTNTGVPIRNSMDILSRELHTEELKKEAKFILDGINKGKKFCDCVNAPLFNEYILAMLKAGEENGQLDYTFIKIANCLKTEIAFID